MTRWIFEPGHTSAEFRARHMMVTNVRGLITGGVTGELTIRGVTRETSLDARYLGMWSTSYWDGGEDRGPVRRIGFTAKTVIDRHDFGVSWNGTLDRGGVVVGDDVWLRIDVEALEAEFLEGLEG